MASLTIRKLDGDLKKRLRLQAARHGRSMEEEVRHLLAGQFGAAGPVAASPIVQVTKPDVRASPIRPGSHLPPSQTSASCSSSAAGSRPINRST
jgi:plasmid stability protein